MASVWLVVAYAAFSAAGVTLSGSFTATRKAVLVAACATIAALLPLAVTGRLGVPGLPLIVVGPSLPFIVATLLNRPVSDADLETEDPSPTLSALLRGKHSGAGGGRVSQAGPQKGRSTLLRDGMAREKAWR